MMNLGLSDELVVIREKNLRHLRSHPCEISK